MRFLLVCLLAVFVLGLRSGNKRREVKWAIPLLIGCCFVALAYLSQRVV